MKKKRLGNSELLNSLPVVHHCHLVYRFLFQTQVLNTPLTPISPPPKFNYFVFVCVNSC